MYPYYKWYTKNGSHILTASCLTVMHILGPENIFYGEQGYCSLLLLDVTMQLLRNHVTTLHGSGVVAYHILRLFTTNYHW